jgi:hypothetical protein
MLIENLSIGDLVKDKYDFENLSTNSSWLRIYKINKKTIKFTNSFGQKGTIEKSSLIGGCVYKDGNTFVLEMKEEEEPNYDLLGKELYIDFWKNKLWWGDKVYYLKEEDNELLLFLGDLRDAINEHVLDEISDLM